MGDRYRVTIRVRGATDRTRHATLPEALEALEARLRTAAGEVQPQTRHALRRTYEPVAQVAVRGELAGPRGLRAGIDVRGDGSAEAFTGRLVRHVVDQEPREDAYAALRRVTATSRV